MLSSESELLGAFEGVYVEEGIYKFFDEVGAPLKAEFVTPNTTRQIFGVLTRVVSGNYRLVAADSSTLPCLSDLLESIPALGKKSHFSSIEEVREFLTFHPGGPR